MAMLTASFLGRDCPGIVAVITGLFGESGCNITAMSQTMLNGEFAAIFIVATPQEMTPDGLRAQLEKGFARAGIDMSIIVRPAMDSCWGDGVVTEPFVVSVDGPDKPGLIGAMSRVFSRHNVNIENLKAILSEMTQGNAMFVFEVMVPETVDIGRLRRELNLEGKNLGLRVSIQHRNVFEAFHRLPLV